MQTHTTSGLALTNLILEVFAANGELLAQGNRITKPYGLTSARWQVMGAIDLAGRAMTVAQIARRMGLARQGVQRIVNDLTVKDLVVATDNIDHKKANLISLSSKGKQVLAKVSDAQVLWVNELSAKLEGRAAGLDERAIERASQLLKAIRQRP